MHITHSYIGTIKGSYRCLLFLLIEDYIETQTQFAHELDLNLERFARKLGDNAALIRPFVGDIETVRQHVLGKAWSEKELREIYNTPALLMLNQDFNDFDPRTHPWMVINFGRKVTGWCGGQLHIEHLLGKLVEAITDTNTDFFKAANDLEYEIKGTEFARVFEAKPGVFGFSINLFYAADILNKIYRRMRRPRVND